jgi:hypothetical protein
VLEDSVRRLDLHHTVVLPDVVVDCFRMSVQSVEGAAAVARSIKSQRLGGPIRLELVAMHVEHGDVSKVDPDATTGGISFMRLSPSWASNVRGFRRTMVRRSLVGGLRHGVGPAEDTAVVYGGTYGAGEGLGVCPCRASMWCWSCLCRRCGCLVSSTGRTTAGRIPALRPRRSRRARCRVSG